jgi:hypothetical protein
MSTPDSDTEDSDFLAQFEEIVDDSLLSDSARKYVAVHRSGSFKGGKLGRKPDGSIHLFAIDPDFGPLCAAITPPTDPAALKAQEDESREYVRRAKAKKR